MQKKIVKVSPMAMGHLILAWQLRLRDVRMAAIYKAMRKKLPWPEDLTEC